MNEADQLREVRDASWGDRIGAYRRRSHPTLAGDRGCDLDFDLAERIGREQGIRTYTNAESMLDAISIYAPAKTHFPLTKLAADRGMHVLCEKPMASNVEDCRRMIAVCRERGVMLMIGHTKRYVPMLARLRELIDGELGSADYMLRQYPDPGKSPRD